ncbi:MAG: YesL family protein [Clostridiales bacterium]|nr:YesL family protein [Clostridiales bacterium]
MSSFFDKRSVPMKFLTALCNLMLVNFCFIIGCIPIFTIGASITSLYRITIKIAAGENPSIFREFFSCYKENFLKSTGFWIVYCILTAFFLFEIYMVRTALPKDYQWSMYPAIFFLFAIFSSASYAFPLIGWFDETVKQTIKNSLLLAITNLPTTILFAIVSAGVAFAWIVDPQIQIITFSILIFMGFGIIAILFSFFLKRIFEKHGAVITPEEEITG